MKKTAAKEAAISSVQRAIYRGTAYHDAVPALLFLIGATMSRDCENERCWCEHVCTTGCPSKSGLHSTTCTVIREFLECMEKNK
jgi:hypothetical protein